MHISQERMALVSSDANVIFGEAYPVNGDYMLAAMLRAIAIEHSGVGSPELPRNGHSVRFYKVDEESEFDELFGLTDEAVIIVEARRGYFPASFECPNGWKSLDDAPYPISRYLSQFIKTRVFVNEEKRRVIAVTGGCAGERWMQAFISTLPRIMTWYFASDLTEAERAFFKAISVNNKEVTPDDAERIFVEYINSVACKYNLRDVALHRCLDGFEKQNHDRQVEQASREVDEITERIQAYQDRLAGEYGRLSERQRLLKSLEMSSGAGSTELFDFFHQHKCLSVLRAREGDIVFGVDETLEFYDEDEFDSVASRENSYFHNTDVDQRIITVMKAVFGEHRGVFVTNAVFKLSGMRYISMLHELSEVEVLPHPHIYFYRCAGGNDQYYSKYADSGEWQLAIEQAICATKNINFGDSVVVTNMMRWLDDHRNVRCIRTSDGERIVSVNEFLKIIGEGECQNG